MLTPNDSPNYRARLRRQSGLSGSLAIFRVSRLLRIIAELQTTAPQLHYAVSLLWSFTESWIAQRWELNPGQRTERHRGHRRCLISRRLPGLHDESGHSTDRRQQGALALLPDR